MTAPKRARRAMTFRPFSRLLSARDGNIAVLTALLLPVMIGVVALMTEFGGSLLTKVRLQRTADLAAYAAAQAYGANSVVSTISTTAKSVGALNGVEASSITASLVSSPRGDGAETVKVDVTETNPLRFAAAIGFSPTLTVKATAYASLAGGVDACVLALSGSGAGVTMSGGTALSAPKCAIASNVSVSVPCGTSITAKEVDYAGATPSQPCSGIKGPSGGAATLKKRTTPDPLASDANVAAARTRQTSVAALASPVAPSVPSGTDIDFGWDQTATKNSATAIGCTATWSQPVWTLTCPDNGIYRFGKLSMGGGISLNFSVNGSPFTTYTFSKPVTLVGSPNRFGPGVYTFAAGLRVENGSTTFGAGTFNFGRVIDSCNGAYYSVCTLGGSSVVFGGPSVFSFNSGVYAGDNVTLTLGSGTANSFDIGAASTGAAVTNAGSTKLTFADALGSGGVFRAAGNLNLLGGGSCTILPAAQQQDVKGYLSAGGAVVFGAGVYTVKDYVAFGDNWGGSASCNGATVSAKAENVTFVIGGASTPTGQCSGKIFCLGAGYSNAVFAAPTSGATAKLAVVGPSSGSAGAAFVQGASNTSISGVLYVPTGPVLLGGGASVGSGAACLQIIGSEVTLTGGTAAASTCVSGSKSGGAVSLVQ